MTNTSSLNIQLTNQSFYSSYSCNFNCVPNYCALKHTYNAKTLVALSCVSAHKKN